MSPLWEATGLGDTSGTGVPNWSFGQFHSRSSRLLRRTACQNELREAGGQGFPSLFLGVRNYGTVTVARFESLLSTPLLSTAVTT